MKRTTLPCKRWGGRLQVKTLAFVLTFQTTGLAFASCMLGLKLCQGKDTRRNCSLPLRLAGRQGLAKHWSLLTARDPMNHVVPDILQYALLDCVHYDI